jgi:hypothetical protein
VAPRVSPTETIRAEIHELFASGGELLSVIEQVARLSVRLTFQASSKRSSVRSSAAAGMSAVVLTRPRAIAMAGSSQGR